MQSCYVRVNATKACRHIENSVMASCIRSSRIGDGLIDFSVGVIVVMYCPFTHLKNICAGICWNTWFILKHWAFFHRPVWSYDSLFRRTSYDFQSCWLAVL